MSEHLLPRDLMERLARVDSKLEKLLAHQTLPQDEGLAETQPSPDEKFSEDILVAESEDEKIHTAAGLSERSRNPLPFRVAVSALEADSIFQKVEKINRDVEVMERMEKLERQNRKIVILGSMFITLVILMIGVSSFLMFQADLLHQGIFLKTWQRINPPQPSSGEAAAKVTVPQPPKPIAGVHDPEPAEPIAKVGDPQPVATLTVPKPAETTSPGKYVGSITSNKYHYPGCKWAAQIMPHNLLNFSTTGEARKRGYIPCPTCRPPHSEQEKFGP
jgi:tetrahydromethanopterin S-methyltransferase subunit G